MRELNLLSHLIYKARGTEPDDPAFKTDLVLPEALILKVMNFHYYNSQAYCLLSGTPLVERYTSEGQMRDDIYGDYPFILYRHFFIARGNIAKFCKMMTGINNLDRINIS